MVIKDYVQGRVSKLISRQYGRNMPPSAPRSVDSTHMNYMNGTLLSALFIEYQERIGKCPKKYISIADRPAVFDKPSVQKDIMDLIKKAEERDNYHINSGRSSKLKEYLGGVYKNSGHKEWTKKNVKVRDEILARALHCYEEVCRVADECLLGSIGDPVAAFRELENREW